MRKIIVAIDNGVTGSIAIIDGNKSYLFPSPVKKEQSYTKTKQSITRIDFQKLYDILKKYKDEKVIAILERPMVNPMRFKASMSAIRCLEATLICFESLGFSIIYCDSKEWQFDLLPHPTRKGKKRKLNIREKVKNKQKAESRSLLKKQSLDIAKRLFPKLDFSGFEDGDSILIAEWARRKNL